MSDYKRNENLLLTEKIHAFHKYYYIDYKENQRGRFLKITEKDGRFKSTVIIPEEAVGDLAKVLNKITEQFNPDERTADKKLEFEEKRKEFEKRRAERQRFYSGENDSNISDSSSTTDDPTSIENTDEKKDDDNDETTYSF